MYDIAIVGAGLAGLAAGWELQQAGLRVVVFEESSLPGGRARTERADAFLIETGAQFVLDIYERVQRLCRRAGQNIELRRVRGRDHEPGTASPGQPRHGVRIQVVRVGVGDQHHVAVSLLGLEGHR